METFVAAVFGIGGACLLVLSLDNTFAPDFLKAALEGRGGAVLTPPLAPGGPLGGPPGGSPGSPPEEGPAPGAMGTPAPTLGYLSVKLVL